MSGNNSAKPAEVFHASSAWRQRLRLRNARQQTSVPPSGHHPVWFQPVAMKQRHTICMTQAAINLRHALTTVP